MSLARTALRLAAVEALAPFALAKTGPWPTIAGERVFDTRIDLLQEGADLDTLEAKPLLVVYTEEDVSTPYGQAKYPADEQVVHLVVEAMIAARGIVEIDLGNGETQSVPALMPASITDLEQEMLIDVLEDQVRVALDPENRSVASGELFRKVAMERRQIESYPQRDASRPTRLIARTIKLHIKVNKGKRASVPASPVLTGLDLLPEPLRSVAKGLPTTSPGYEACLAVVGMLQPPAPVPPQLTQIGIVSVVDGSPATIESVVVTTTDPAYAPTEPADPTLPPAAPAPPAPSAP